MRRLIHKIFSIFFSNFCAHCGEKTWKFGLCDPCACHLVIRDGPCCALCNRKFAGFSGGHRCGECLKSVPPFEQIFGLFDYRGPIGSLIRVGKYTPCQRTVSLLGKLSVHALPRKIRDAPPDYIIPIPSHWRRRLKRPVEPAHEVAAQVAAVLNRPVKTWWLGRHRHTARQAGLDRRARARNVKDAFRYRGLQGVSILLVDDVYTTGMTVRSAAKCLKAGGVSEVWVLTVAYVDHE